MHRTNSDGNGWRRFDPESVVSTTGGIHHGASIVQNLRAIVEDALHALPDRMLLLPVLAWRDGPLTAVVALLVGVVHDLLELIAFPFAVLKNLVDVAAHALAALRNAVRGEADGCPLPTPPFEVLGLDSFLRLLLGLDCELRDTSEPLEPLLDLEGARCRWSERPGRPASEPVRELASFDGDVRWCPRIALRPGPGRAELAHLLGHLHRTLPARMRIKAGGARHSHGAGRTSGVYLHPEGLQFLERLPAQGSRGDTLRRGTRGREALFRVGSGVPIRRLNESLWAAGFSLPVAAGHDGQTIAGALATGTHGSVLSRGPMAEMVRSLDLVLVDGTVVRIEPAGGITEPASLHEVDPELTLVQDDDLFRAVLLGLGACGVVHSLVLEAVPRYHIEERTSESTVAEVSRILAGGNVYRLVEVPTLPPWVSAPEGKRFPGHPGRAYAMSVLINPHTGRAQISTGHQLRLGTEPADLRLRVERCPAKAFARHPDFVRRPVLWRALLSAAPRVLSRLPLLLPRLGLWTTPQVVDWSVKGSARFVNRSYHVFHSGDGVERVRIRFGEFFVPLRDDRYLVALHVLLDAARRWSIRTGTYQTGPTNVRFVRGGTALLDPPEDYAAFECLFLGAPAHTDSMMKAYQDALTARLGSDGFTMHFGMRTPGWTPEEVLVQHPGYSRWRLLRDALDPKGRMLSPEQDALLPPVPREEEARLRQWRVSSR